MSSQIHLIRHGITEGNQRRLYYGASDLPLAQEGVAELETLVASGVYPAFEEAVCYTTGLLRTEQTFAAIYGDKERSHLVDLQEMRFGDFEMKHHDELKDQPLYQEWIADKTGMLASPGGESRNAFIKRVTKGFRQLVDDHVARESSSTSGNTVTTIVCHGGTIGAIMEDLFPNTKEHFFQWIPNPGHGYSLTIVDGGIVSYESF